MRVLGDKKYNAFTLVEMLVVMGILVILMTMGIFAGRFAIQRANKVQHQSAADQIYQGLQSYYADNREYPPTSGTEAFDAFGTALTTTGVLGKYVDSSAFDGGSDATYYYAVDATGQSMLICVTYGGHDDATNQGAYCNGNGFGTLPSGTPVSKKELTADEADAVLSSFTVSNNWDASTRSWQ